MPISRRRETYVAATSPLHTMKLMRKRRFILFALLLLKDLVLGTRYDALGRARIRHTPISGYRRHDLTASTAPDAAALTFSVRTRRATRMLTA